MKEKFTPTTGTWAWSVEHGQSCRVIEVQKLFGREVARVWLPRRNVVVRVDTSDLLPVSASPPPSANRIQFVTAAARLADLLSKDVLLAPIGASVIPLPHQLQALQRAIATDRVRYLLADEVGLGKTIEGGLIARELKLRGMAKRILVLAPKGLVTQWISEMEVHFGERFHLVTPADLERIRDLTGEENPWRAFDQVVCPMDSVKPIEGRRGWTLEQVTAYNEARFGSLIAAGWDLIIVDEAHRLGGSTDAVARYRLGQGLAESAPYLLLLSATPHQGKTDAFHRLMALLDPMAFPDAGAVTQERVRSYVIRTEKRLAIDANGQPLFKPRVSKLVTVTWDERHRDQRALYEAVTEYVREGYNQAVREKKPYIGFLMILMQRLVTSSTRAIRQTLEKRLAALEEQQEEGESQLSLLPTILDEEWSDLDGEEQIQTLVRTRMKALRNEREEVRLLLDLARRTEGAGIDAKAQALVDLFYRLQQEEGDPELKYLIFTEFVPSQEMLRALLEERGFPVTCLNGSMDMEARRDVQRLFAGPKRVLISTDAGGEGLNLQFAHIVINFDVPWNPMRLEQRIGRVDRIGQRHTVRAFNFLLADTVEHRVQQVIEDKLQVILEEIGIDKTSDLLDSADVFDDLYVSGLVDPSRIDSALARVAERMKTEGQRLKATQGILGHGSAPDPKAAGELLDHPVQAWIERMMLAHLAEEGGTVVRQGDGMKITWPDGAVDDQIVFSARQAAAHPQTSLLTLEHARVRGLLSAVGSFEEGLPVPVVTVDDLPSTVSGWWSLWRVSIRDEGWRAQRIVPVFVQDDGKSFPRTAKHTWDAMLSQPIKLNEPLSPDESVRGVEVSETVIEEVGSAALEELVQEHRRQLDVETERGRVSFASRRAAISKLGLPAVRERRLADLLREEEQWQQSLRQRARVVPDRALLLLLAVRGGTDGLA